MVEGVTKGYEKTLEIKGVGYRAPSKATSWCCRWATPIRSRWRRLPGIEFEVPAADPYRVQRDRQRVGRRGGGQDPCRPQARALPGQRDHVRGERISRKAGKAGKVVQVRGE